MAIHPILFNSKMVRIAKKPRLIDANALLNRLPKVDLDHDERITKSGAVADMIYLINNTPTIEAEPVRHGYWIGLEGDGYAGGFPVYDVWECSSCKDEWNGEETPCYCPNCGAKMDGGVEDGNQI